MPKKPRSFDSPFAPAVVLGGRGKMGEWYLRFLAAQGIEAVPYDLEEPEALQTVIDRSRLIFLSVPMSAAVELIKKIAPHLKAGQLVVDACSVKTPIVQAIEALLPAKVEFLGLHTMFGPWSELQSRENVIALKSPKAGKLAEKFTELFSRAGFKLHWATAEEHDRLTACTQSLMHFLLFALGGSLTRLGITVKDLEPYLTPNSRHTLDAMQRILNQSPDLSLNIQNLNPFAADARRRFLEAAFQMQAGFEQNSDEEFLSTIKNYREKL